MYANIFFPEYFGIKIVKVELLTLKI